MLSLHISALFRTGVVALAAASIAASVATADEPARKYRVLHIMSYHASWEWNREQFDAFRHELKDLDVEYRVVEMDTKRRSDPAWMDEVSTRARHLIDTWKPDLVYTNDDSAQQHVVMNHPPDRTRFVFSAVNAAPSTYGFDRRRDVTGVLEHEHILQTLNLLREIAPGTRRIAVLLDDGPTWPGLVARMKAVLQDVKDIEVVSYDTIRTYAEYQKKVRDYHGKVDALGVLGVFTLKDADGKNVPFDTVLKWTAENSRLPDFSFWGSRMPLGTLCSVTVSGTAQGREAGKIAREILLTGRSPHTIPMTPTLKGVPVINLVRAKQLGIKLQSSTLLKSQVVTKYAWD